MALGAPSFRRRGTKGTAASPKGSKKPVSAAEAVVREDGNIWG